MVLVSGLMCLVLCEYIVRRCRGCDVAHVAGAWVCLVYGCCYVVSMSMLVSSFGGRVRACLDEAFFRQARWCLDLFLSLWDRCRVDAVVGGGVGQKAEFRRVFGTVPVRRQFAMKRRTISAIPCVARSLHLYDRGSR